jgi:hypothetical protein
MAFPSTNITLKQVCDAYGVASNMAALRGNQFLDSSNNLQTVPIAPNPISLSIFRGSTPLRTLPDQPSQFRPPYTGPNTLTLGDIKYTFNSATSTVTSFTCKFSINWTMVNRDNVNVIIESPNNNILFKNDFDIAINGPNSNYPVTATLTNTTITNNLIIKLLGGSNGNFEYFLNTFTYPITSSGIGNVVIS